VETKERCTNNWTMRCEGKTSLGLDDELRDTAYATCWDAQN
jgi:hypothetical protein